VLAHSLTYQYIVSGSHFLKHPTTFCPASDIMQTLE